MPKILVFTGKLISLNIRKTIGTEKIFSYKKALDMYPLKIELLMLFWSQIKLFTDHETFNLMGKELCAWPFIILDVVLCLICNIADLLSYDVF